MRLIANRDSAEAGEFSLLAILETMIATVLFFAYFYWMHKTWHIVVTRLIPLSQVGQYVV